MSPEWSGVDPVPPNTRSGDQPSILHRDIETWLPGLHGGPLRVQDSERKQRRRTTFATSSDRWMWATLAVVAAGFLTAVWCWR